MCTLVIVYRRVGIEPVDEHSIIASDIRSASTETLRKLRRQNKSPSSVTVYYHEIEYNDCNSPRPLGCWQRLNCSPCPFRLTCSAGSSKCWWFRWYTVLVRWRLLHNIIHYTLVTIEATFYTTEVNVLYGWLMETCVCKNKWKIEPYIFVTMRFFINNK